MFKYKYDSCFIWIDVEQSVLNRRVDTRVDEMVNAGLVNEVRQIFIPDADYTKGILRSISVPEMARYLREEKYIDEDDELKKMILQASISSIKRNTHILICNQLDKIQRLINEKMWSVHHIFATDVFKEDRKEAVDEAWRNTVLQPCLDIVIRFLKNDDHNITKMNTFINNNNKFNKKKVVFIMGSTGMRMSRLSVDLANHFQGEIIYSEKMQVYKGLEIVTNKITRAEKQGEIEPDCDFTVQDFCMKSIVYIENCLKTQCIPIIVGESNLYIEKPVEDPVFMFKYKYDSFFIWIDIEQSVLNRRVDTRDDEMVNADSFYRKEAVDEAWRNTVLQPYLDIVKRFLKNDDHNIIIECT
ncbi:hypothetical protein H5410_001665 [Solanum commersonii]|uniref:adenylate dimethylallyltransferase (ADP/ATP-dependent) n=1 Tax=Solanum commersonii TaxID=4109 RepID=A0A9J6AZT1_SOLCO|nr:hypothetical protein H5410_001665 [Solanum commersonii]